MNVASHHNVFLFNFRGSSEALQEIASISSKKTGTDGTKLLYNILLDAENQHGLSSLDIPKNAAIELKSKYIYWVCT